MIQKYTKISTPTHYICNETDHECKFDKEFLKGCGLTGQQLATKTERVQSGRKGKTNKTAHQIKETTVCHKALCPKLGLTWQMHIVILLNFLACLPEACILMYINVM